MCCWESQGVVEIKAKLKVLSFWNMAKSQMDRKLAKESKMRERERDVKRADS